jgi:hypothetical protein
MPGMSGIALTGGAVDGRRPVNDGEKKYQEDQNWRDCIQFYEYFHGDTGVGVGASHQTG